VEIEFIGRDLRALCNNKAALARRWGAERGALVAQRLAELHALDRLADLSCLPHIHVEDRGDKTTVSVGTDLALVVTAGRAAGGSTLETLMVHAVQDQSEEL
jgi:hypothetical protein